MEKVAVQIEVPKESKEIVDFLAGIVEAIKAGGNTLEIISAQLPQAMVAIEGYKQVPEELKSTQLSELVGYLAVRLGDALGK